MINILRNTKQNLMNIYECYFMRKKLITSCKPKVFVMLAADYSNIGDVAISYAQKEFLKRIFPNRDIIEVPVADTCKVYLDMKKNTTSKDIITLIGGGNTCEKYMSIEKYRRFIIKKFKNNKIIAFPQTIDFSNDRTGRYALDKSKKIYSKNKNLILSAREAVSYNEFKKQFTENRVIYVPDIVLSLNKKNVSSRKGIVITLRDDQEKKLSVNDEKKLKRKLELIFNDITYMDTCVSEFEYEKRLIYLDEILNTYRNSELVITDRLHGMIFCVITGTPCIVLPNSNHKITQTYSDWLQECTYVKLVDKFEVNYILNIIDEMKNKKDQQSFNLNNKYDNLKEILLNEKVI